MNKTSVQQRFKIALSLTTVDRACAKYGRKWRTKAQSVPGRADIQIKSRFESYIKKKVATLNLMFK